MKNNNFKLWKLFCEICSWTKTVRNLDEVKLVTLKKSPIQGKLPSSINPNTKKIEVPKFLEPVKQFKCPSCGRVITPRQITDTPALDREQERIKKLLERD